MLRYVPEAGPLQMSEDPLLECMMKLEVQRIAIVAGAGALVLSIVLFGSSRRLGSNDEISTTSYVAPVYATVAEVDDQPRDEATVANESEQQSNDLEKAWARCLEAMLIANARRHEEVENAVNRIVSAGKRLCREADTDSFVTEAVDLMSQGSRAYDASAWQQWIAERYEYHIFSTSAFCREVQLEAHLLNDGLTRADEDALVAMECDVDFEPLSVPDSCVELDDVPRYVEWEVSQVLAAVEAANNSQIASTGVGLVTGLVAERAAHSYSADENGEVSWGQALGGLLIGIAADTISSAAIDSVTEAIPEAKRKVAESVVRLGERLRRDGVSTLEIVEQLTSLSEQHEARLLVAVIEALDVDYDEATQIYFAAKAARQKSNE